MAQYKKAPPHGPITRKQRLPGKPIERYGQEIPPHAAQDDAWGHPDGANCPGSGKAPNRDGRCPRCGHEFTPQVRVEGQAPSALKDPGREKGPRYPTALKAGTEGAACGVGEAGVEGPQGAPDDASTEPPGMPIEPSSGPEQAADGPSDARLLESDFEGEEFRAESGRLALVDAAILDAIDHPLKATAIVLPVKSSETTFSVSANFDDSVLLDLKVEPKYLEDGSIEDGAKAASQEEGDQVLPRIEGRVYVDANFLNEAKDYASFEEFYADYRTQMIVAQRMMGDDMPISDAELRPQAERVWQVMQQKKKLGGKRWERAARGKFERAARGKLGESGLNLGGTGKDSGLERKMRAASGSVKQRRHNRGDNGGHRPKPEIRSQHRRPAENSPTGKPALDKECSESRGIAVATKWLIENRGKKASPQEVMEATGVSKESLNFALKTLAAMSVGGWETVDERIRHPFGVVVSEDSWEERGGYLQHRKTGKRPDFNFDWLYQLRERLNYE